MDMMQTFFEEFSKEFKDFSDTYEIEFKSKTLICEGENAVKSHDIKKMKLIMDKIKDHLKKRRF